MLHCPPQVQTYYYNKTTTVTCFIFFVVFHIVFNFSKILHTASLRNNYLALQLFGSSTRIRQYYNNKKSLVFLFLSVYHHHNQKKRNFKFFTFFICKCGKLALYKNDERSVLFLYQISFNHMLIKI